MPDTFKDRTWRVSYKSSSLDEQGRPINVLREFYIPALSRTVSYDRVAGYFRSSSLAAASEGYTAILNRENGHIRLIVGADLAEEDVRAILNGDEQRMIDELNNSLSEPENWQDAVQDGVALLGAMIAAGRMELRVAFKKNIVTGEAMTLDDVSDGYVHEKWFVMKDADGNRIGGEGSLNESRTALMINAENVAVSCSWKAETDAERVQEYEKSFSMLWNNRNPGFEVLSLPEAVRNRLITIAQAYGKVQEIDERLRQLRKKPKAMDLLRFAVLKDAPLMPCGEMIGLYTAPVEPWPHQEIVARKLIQTWPYSWMLCDEVGLGKTIESALAMRSLYLSGLANRILVAAPKSLTKQWHRELQEKAMLSFALSTASPKIRHEYLGQEEVEEDGQLFSPALNIISTGLLAREKHEKSLSKSKGYEIALVDEAHYARRRNPADRDESQADYGKLYHAIDHTLVKKAGALWLATATPMQINPIETWDLLRLTGRAGSYLSDPTLTLDYYSVLGKLVRDESLTPEEWRFLGRSYEQIKASDPYVWHQIQITCVDGKNSKTLKNLPIHDQQVKHADRKYLNRPLFAASPLSRVMMRHNRGLLEVYRQHGELNSNLAHRHVLPLMTVDFTPTEKRLYDMLEEYCAELNRQIQSANENARTMMGFLLNFFQLRFASSIEAIRLTLKRRLEKVKLTLQFGSTQDITTQEELDERIAEIKAQEDLDIDESDLDEITLDSLLKDRSPEDLKWEKGALERMLAEYESMHETPSKIQKLLERLDERKKPGGRMQQTVLFTRFLDSLHSIRQYLKNRSSHLRVGVYAGQEAIYYNPDKYRDCNTTHEEIKRLFREGEIDLLLCTDAAAEGLNLQSADLLINFDLGWNPMKIEQRIGRIDRIGQVHSDIFVLNLCYVGSTEEVVYGRLWSRLQEAGLIVGTQQVSLLPVEAEDFRKLAEGKMTEAQLEKKAKAKLAEQKQISTSMEISPEDQYSMYRKSSEAARQDKLPADLNCIWDALQKATFLESSTEESEQIWRSEGTDQIPRLEGTIDRKLISEDCPFLTWGNRRFDAFLQVMTDILEEQHPHCVSRLQVQLDSRTYVAWLAVNKQGKKVIISDYSALDALELDEHGTLTDEDRRTAASSFLRTLKDGALSGTVDRVQVLANNQTFAKAQHFLVTYAATQFLQQQADSGNTGAWNAVKELDQARSTKGKRLVLPWKPSEYMDWKYLFPATKMGNQVIMPVGDLLYDCVVQRCFRAINAIKHKKKSQITVDELISNIKRNYQTSNG